MILGYILKSDKQFQSDSMMVIQVEKLEEDITYYKKLTKQLADENMEFRRKK
jgi:hypothetical protein